MFKVKLMKHYPYLLISIFFFLSACAGVDSQTKKSFRNIENTIALKDLTTSDYRKMDASSQLESAIEEMISRSMFVLTQENPKYVLKYKVLGYDEGNRITRFATFGISKAAHGRLEVKAALFEHGEMVGAWTIDSWVKGGVTGGDPVTLFQQAADEIMDRLRGDF